MKVAPDYFYVLNLDKKGAPELVITSRELTSRARDFYVYIFKDGEVKYAGTCYSNTGNLDPKFTYSPKCKGIYTGGYTTINGKYGIQNSVYTIKSNKLVMAHHTKASYDGTVYIASTTKNQNKKVSLKSFKKFENKYYKNMKYYTMHDNTDANRKDYIK